MNKTNPLYYEKILEYVPDYLRGSKIYSMVQSIQQDELNNIYDDMNDVQLQLSPLTCTWAMDYWEKEYNITKTTDNLELRRAKVLSKMAVSTPLTPQAFANLLSGFANDVEVTNVPGQYKFNVVLTMKSNFDLTLTDIRNVIDEAKPAHLIYEVQFGFLDEIGIEIEFKTYIHKCNLCGTVLTGPTLYM